METSGQGIWVIDEQGKTIYANARLGEIVGFAPDELSGLPVKSVLLDDDGFSDDWTRTRIHSDALTWHEARLRTRGGEIRHTIIAVRAIGADEIPGDGSLADLDARRGLLLVVTDVTSLKKAEEALEEKESVLRSFYESSAMAMGVVELSENSARFVSSNALTDRFFSVEADELEMRSAEQLKAHPPILASWTERFRECQVTRGPVRFEQKGSGTQSPEWIAVTLAPMGSTGSDRNLCSFIVEDITDRKRARLPSWSKPRRWPRRRLRPRTDFSRCSATSCGRRLLLY